MAPTGTVSWRYLNADCLNLLVSIPRAMCFLVAPLAFGIYFDVLLPTRNSFYKILGTPPLLHFVFFLLQEDCTTKSIINRKENLQVSLPAGKLLA